MTMPSNVYPLVPPILEFKGWPKITRYAKSFMTITEKIDGTNAAVGVMRIQPGMEKHPDLASPAVTVVTLDDDSRWMVYAQSRKRIISPHDDNYGFARWVHENAETLTVDLGEGLNFGEWWGSGIQRGYGIGSKNFSVFNTLRYEQADADVWATRNLRIIPELYRGPVESDEIELAFNALGTFGSAAVPGWMRPEGIVVFLPDMGGRWKRTFDANDQSKYLAQAKVDSCAA